MKLKIGLVLLIGVLLGGCSMQDKNKEESFSFVLAADTRAYTGDDINMFRGACEAIKKAGESAFIISPGDVDPPDRVFYTMQKYIDKDIIWYPIIGNHEEETVSDMEWIRNHNKNGNKRWTPIHHVYGNPTIQHMYTQTNLLYSKRKT